MVRHSYAIGLLAILGLSPYAFAQEASTVAKPLLFPGAFAGVLPTNSLSHLAPRGNTLWAGTGKGLAVSSDGGKTWTSFASNPQFARPGIYAVAVRGDTIWAATGYTKDVNGSSVQTGSGSTYSTDNGTMWHGIPQPLDPRDDSSITYGSNTVHFLPIVVPEQNVTFSVALSPTAVWIASWSSGLRKSTDLGQTWERIVLPSRFRTSIAPTDSLGVYTIDPRNDNNFLAFSVATLGSDTVWAGTAGGVNLSTDGGLSWVHFTTDIGTSHIASDWVIAIGAQHLRSGTRVWTTNWPAEGANQQYAVSYTDDNGRTWSNQLLGIKAYAFAFRDSIAYVATVDGIYRTADGGTTWMKSGSIVNPQTGSRITTSTFYSVAVIGDTVYGASDDGLASTVDNAAHPFGAAWEIARSSAPSGNPANVYAYPNPYSPSFGSARIHYTTGTTAGNVTIELYDFGMNRVRTLVKDAARSGESDEVWDGRDDQLRTVVNGVYFYRVVINGGTPAWGKILVIQ
jgi:photosystem II stability/assembly factor-like uncharacterized protein